MPYVLIPMQSFLHGLAAFIFFKITYSIFNSKTAALISAILYLTMPFALLTYTQISKDVFFNLALLLFLYSLIALIKILLREGLTTKLIIRRYAVTFLATCVALFLLFISRQQVLDFMQIFIIAFYLLYVILFLIKKSIGYIEFSAVTIGIAVVFITINVIPDSHVSTAYKTDAFDADSEFFIGRNKIKFSMIEDPAHFFSKTALEEFIKNPENFNDEGDPLRFKAVVQERLDKLIAAENSKITEAAFAIIQAQERAIAEQKQKEAAAAFAIIQAQERAIAEQKQKEAAAAFAIIQAQERAIAEQKQKDTKETAEQKEAAAAFAIIQAQERAIAEQKQKEAAAAFAIIQAQERAIAEQKQKEAAAAFAIIKAKEINQAVKITKKLKTRYKTDFSEIEPWNRSSFLPLRLDNKLEQLYSYREYFYRYSSGATTIDRYVTLNSAGAMVMYLPKAIMHGLFSPSFSLLNNEITLGGKKYDHSSLLKVSILVMTLLSIPIFFSFFGVYNQRRNLLMWVMIVFAGFYLLYPVYAFPNIGAFMRHRYVPHMLIVSIGIYQINWIINKYMSKLSTQNK